MEDKITCSVLTPDRVIYEGMVDYAVVPGFDGEMGFLLNHAPLISELGIGEVRLENSNQTEYLVVHGGFVEIKNNELILLTENAIKKEELSREELQLKLDTIQKKDLPKDFEERNKREIEIEKLKAGLKVASR